MTKLEQLNKQIEELTRQRDTLEAKARAKKGVLDQNEWLLVIADEIWNGEDDYPYIFYNACDTVVCANAYVDVPDSNYISDILYSLRAVKVKSYKKITPSEAIKILENNEL